jgi:sugar/nucleoside kinase (ribokinase family)
LSATGDAGEADRRSRELDLLVLGDLNPDLILSGENVAPEFGQVERLIEGAQLTVGGSGAIVACGAARLGLRTGIVGVVGEDLHGRYMVQELAARGVETGGVIVDPGLQTGLTVVLSRPHDRAILTFPGAISALDAGRVDRARLRGARHVHVASFYLQKALAPGLPELFVDARAAGTTTSLDPNWDPRERWDGGLEALLRLTDVFMPNAEEAMRIAANADPLAGAKSLAAQGPLVALKLGAQGAIAVRAGEQPVRVDPPHSVQPVDTTGAGDSFDAGLLAGLLSGWSTSRALALGCVCGALSTRGTGGISGQPTRREALELLDRTSVGSRESR